MKPRIGITIGDQAGIGYEIICKAIHHDDIIGSADFRIIGEIIPPQEVIYGKVNEEYGRIAGEAIIEAVKLAKYGEIEAIVTAPIHKEALNLAGFPYPGHTEMLAYLTGVSQYAMMLVHKNLRVVHVTTHQSLRDALQSITYQRVINTIRIAHDGCLSLGIEKPRIAVAAINPHASDNGLFGREEEEILLPAINFTRKYNYQVFEKPLPADIVFARAIGGDFDCVIAMYHDQGHIPIKTLGFEWRNGAWDKIDGVNVTLGLPIIRTSPDHGVAFGKAGKGIADPTSMISAIKVAITLAKNRRQNGIS